MNSKRGMYTTAQKPRSLLCVQKCIAVLLVLLFLFTDLGNFLSFEILPEVPQAEASLLPAIKVESFDQDVTTDGSTFTLSNDVGATSSAFIKINTGTRKTSAGPTGSTGNTAPNIGAVGLVLTDTDEVTVERVSATAVKIMGEVWRYEGLENGDHEFIVRERVAVSLTGTSVSTAISGISDVDQVVPFVTGYTLNGASTNDWNDATIAAHMDDSGNLIVSRNNSGIAATVYVDVVEFTGSAWNVCHGYSNAHDTSVQTITLNTDSDGQGGATCDVTDWGTATIIEATMEGDSAETGLSDTLALVNPGLNTTSVLFDVVQKDAGARNDGEAWIHVLQNDALVVNRASDTNIAEGNGTAGTATWPAGATTTAALDTLSLEWFTDTSGTGAAHMRGGLHARITDPTGTIEHWIHRSGNTVGVEYGVVELTGLKYLNATTLVTATGTLTATVDIPTTDNELGGSFVITELTGTRNITNITLTESGTIDGQTGLENIKLFYDLDTSVPYDCASESYGGSEDQFGSTDTNGFSGPNGASSFTAAGAVTISTTQTLCGYVLYDVTESASDSETIAISIANPSADIVVTNSGVVSPDTDVIPAGSTVARNAELTMTHYRWLNDDGVEGAATAIDDEDTSSTGFANGTIRRLRTQVDAAGSTSSLPTTFQLDYATKTAATCGELTNWIDVGASSGAWDMSASTFITDGANATDIAPGSGGVTNPAGQIFLTTNGGLRDTSSQTGSLTFASTSFAEFEFAIEPTVTAPQGNTYCFRVSDVGSDLRAYDVYAEGTISADVDVSASSSQAVSLNAGATGQDIGGQFVISRTGGNRTVTSITLNEVGTIDAQTNLDNITLEYDVDTTAPRDCTGEFNDGDETPFGSTDTDGFSAADGSSTFTGSETVGTNRTMCLYVVLDVGSGAANGETIEIQITDPSSDVIVTTSSVGPSSPISPTGSTTVAGQVRAQTGYHWRNDDGSETAASSATGNTQDTALTDVAKESPFRLRLQVDNEGSISTNPTQYRLEFGTKITTCELVGSWNDVGAVGGAFDLVASTNLTEGNDTTDVTPAANGEITNPGGASFLATNGGQRDTTSQTGNLTLTSSEFVELEYSVEATAEAGDDTTYCFRLSDAGTALESYVLFPELTTREKQDFFVQRGTTIITGTTTTLVAGSNYIAPSATSSAFVRITNSKSTGAGHDIDDDDNTRSPDGWSAYIEDQSDVTTSFTLSRPSNVAATVNTRVSWELIEFTGLPGTDNEMIVRDVGTVTYGATSLNATGTSVATVADDADVVVFITGQFNPATDPAQSNESISTSLWHGTSSVPVFTRGDADSVAARVSYAVVEYTGANWAVQRVPHAYTTINPEPVAITPVTSFNQVFVYAQKRTGDGVNGLHDMGHEVYLSGVSEIVFELHSGTNPVTDPTEHDAVAWVIENMQTGVGAMAVYRSDGIFASGGLEPRAESIGIGGTVNINNASIFVTNNSTGAGTAFPRGILGVTITATSLYELWASDTGQTYTYRTEVIEWPVAEISIRQNYYHFYVDNDALDPTDSWPAGAASVGENASITAVDDPLGEGERVRIRMSLLINNATLPADTKAFKLQFGRLESTCSAITDVNWNDLGSPGSGAIWRGFDGTPADGTELATSTPAPGRLNLSLSDVAGTYEESNNTAINPYVVDIGEDIEYDWAIEHNGANQRSDYCFRMVESDGTVLDGYNNYPTLRTTGYTPVSDTWRWFDDATSTTPVNPLAGEDTAPIDIALGNEIKLRTVVSEVESAAGANVKFTLQFSEFADFSSGVDFLDSSGQCAASSTWCAVDGAGIDGEVIPSAVLSTADSCVAQVGNGCGTHNEASTTASTLVQPALSNMEFEFTLEHRAARAGGVYYFRLYDVTNDEPVIASSTYPSLTILGPQLVFDVSGVSAGVVTEGITADVDTTAVSVPFGSVPFDTEYEAVYRLNLNTSATEGFRLFQYVKQPLLNGYGDEIAAITSTNAAPAAWSTACAGTADGCFGYHTGDDTLSGGSTRFAADDSYAALSTSPEEVMFSSVPTDNTVDIVYKLQIREGQPAGDYSTEIVYLAVPIY